MDIIRRQWVRWKFKYTFLLIVSIVALYYFSHTGLAKTIMERLEASGYIGALVGGIFFVSAYTVAPAAYVLHALGDHIGLLAVALIGGFGAMIGDYLIFRFVRDFIAEEWRPVLRKVHKRRRGRPKNKSLVSKWGLMFLGGLIIASPFPDEAGIGLLGLSNIKVLHFMLLVYVLNSAGIFTVMLIARAL